MNTPASRLRRTVSATAVASALAVLAALAGCGGSGETASHPSTSLQPDTTVASDAAAPASSTPAAPSSTQAPLPMPGAIASGSVVDLECGRVYHGTLDLRGKSNVTVRTSGNCGSAVLSPGQALSGWSRHAGDIYSAPVSAGVAQVTIEGQPLAAAHWPNRPQAWVRAAASTSDSLTYAMPNSDLAGATLVFKPYEWAIEARRITSYSGSTMSVTSTNNINFDGYPMGGAVEFYVEGKLWMLDSPGEWAVSNGRLYVWAPDGNSPEGRVWVSPDRDGIDATNSTSIRLEGISIYGAANGINALSATNLQISDVRITNASANGILNSGGHGLQVDGATIINARHDAIAVKWGGGAEVIRNTRIDNSGAVGMPTNAHAAINLVGSRGATVHNNTVVNSGYIGIRVFRDAVASNNTVDGACLILTDCGGIFASSPDRVVLNTRIENNTVKNVGPAQRLAWGLYLGDFANGLSVTGNTVTDSGNGMEILNGYDNLVSGNVFARNTQAHIQMVEFGSTPVVMNNVVSNNRFTTVGKEEMYRHSSDMGSAAVGRFGSYAGNTYLSSSSIFANYNGEALSFPQWKARTGQDATSTLEAP